MANIAESNVILQALVVLYNTASSIHGATPIYTKHVRCRLDTNKYRKNTRSVLRIADTKKVKPRLSDGFSTARQPLHTVTTHAIRRNDTLGHAASSTKNKKARRPFLAELWNTPSSSGPWLTDALFCGVHTPTSTQTSLEGHYMSTHTDPKVISSTWVLLRSSTHDLALNKLYNTSDEKKL